MHCIFITKTESLVVYPTHQYTIASYAPRFIMLLYALIPKGKKRRKSYMLCIYGKHICSLNLHKRAVQLHWEGHRFIMVLQYTGAEASIFFLRPSLYILNSKKLWKNEI